MNNTRIARPSISTYSIERQKHVEHAAMALESLRRSYVKIAAMTRYDVLANPKSQSCTEETLGRKERVENAFHNLRRNAASVVSNRHAQAPAPGLQVCGIRTPQKDASTRGQRIERVTNEIVEHLPDLALVAKHAF